MKCPILVILAIVLGAIGYAQVPRVQSKFPTPQIPFSPKQYVCYRVEGPIEVDGKLDEVSWRKAVWTDHFVDIEGDLKIAPLCKTRVKMLWDDKFLYVGAEIQEPNLWATLRQRKINQII